MGAHGTRRSQHLGQHHPRCTTLGTDESRGINIWRPSAGRRRDRPRDPGAGRSANRRSRSGPVRSKPVRRRGGQRMRSDKRIISWKQQPGISRSRSCADAVDQPRLTRTGFGGVLPTRLELDLSELAKRFSCRRCAARVGRRTRPATVSLVHGSRAGIELPMAPDREWKRVVRRMRY